MAADGPRTTSDAPSTAQSAPRSPAEAGGRVTSVRDVPLAHLQRSAGNRAVAQMLQGRQALPVQRYAVNVPRDADCATVLEWMNTSNPYVPNWAKTRATHNWRGGISATLIPDTESQYRVRVVNPSVTVSKSVDMPEWQPSDEALQQAWTAMYGTLRAHEARHEGIGDEWRETLLERLQAVDYEVSASSQAEAVREGQAMVNADWQMWVADHQDAQEDIDPYTAPLACPAPAEEEAPEEGEAPEAEAPEAGAGTDPGSDS